MHNQSIARNMEYVKFECLRLQLHNHGNVVTRFNTGLRISSKGKFL